jgi:hypothetical protein
MPVGSNRVLILRSSHNVGHPQQLQEACHVGRNRHNAWVSCVQPASVSLAE